MPLKKAKPGMSKNQKQKIASKNISELMHKFDETGKIGTSKPASRKAALKQSEAIGIKAAGLSKKKK